MNTACDPEVIAATTITLKAVQEAGEDFEWYPTTQKMIDVVAKRITDSHCSIMDIGAGDGRVLVELAKRREGAELYAIEKSVVLTQAQPETIVPVGTDFFEQNLTALPMDYIFSNPPYSQFEAWASIIIESGYAKKAFLIIPQRWRESKQIQAALKKRGAKARTVHSDDFLEGDRSSRAVVDIVEVTFPCGDDYYHKPTDPFDIWFDQNISTFDQEEVEDLADYQRKERDLAKLRHLGSIPDMVASYNEEHGRMEENYRAIFKLDHALLQELGVNKDGVREGIKKKMAGLKNKYWHLLFERLDVITSRLATETKKRFLERLTGRTAVAFTESNAYVVVLWAIKNANKYYNEQLVKLFRDLSTHEGVLNYKSNQRTWQKDGWRYSKDGHSHYSLDYRIVLDRHTAIKTDEYCFSCTGNLANDCHEVIDDIIAVFNNLGLSTRDTPSRHRNWFSGQWQDFYLHDERMLFQVKAHKNGNLHFRFMPEAIMRLNVEAGRLLGWLRGPDDAVTEIGCTPDEAATCFGASVQLGASSVKLLSE